MNVHWFTGNSFHFCYLCGHKKLIFSKTECWHCSNRRDLARLLVDSNPGPLTQWEPILLTYIRPSAWLTVPSETLRNFESSNPSLYGMESLRTGGLKERRGAYKLAVMMFSLRYFKRLKQKNEQAFFLLIPNCNVDLCYFNRYKYHLGIIGQKHILLHMCTFSMCQHQCVQ